MQVVGLTSLITLEMLQVAYGGGTVGLGVGQLPGC
jgi:hypothetical protein